MASSQKSGFALVSEEESLQDELLGTGLAFQVDDDEDGDGDGVDGDGDGDRVPQDGMEYLKQVVKEANKLDAVQIG